MSQVLAGIDLGGTNIKAALARHDGTRLIERTIPTESHRGPQGVIDRMAELLLELAAEQDTTLESVGIGVPGLLDIAAGVTKFLPNFPTQWREIPLAATLSDRLGCPVRLLNDVRTATLAELKFGHGRQHPGVTLIFFSLGTGVGGGVVVDGKLRLGPLGAAGEIGHQTMIADGLRCGCGNRGCLETLSSGPAIIAEGVRLLRMGHAPRLHELVQGDANRVTPREMGQAAIDGDQLVGEAIDRAAEWIGIAAANLVTALHPELIVLGGKVADLGDLLLGTVKETIVRRVGMFSAADVEVVRSELGDQAGVMGALALAAQTEI